MRTPNWLTALSVDVGIRRREDGGVARNELRHDTTCSLHTHEQESDVQEQQILHLCERFAREGGHQEEPYLASTYQGS